MTAIPMMTPENIFGHPGFCNVDCTRYFGGTSTHAESVLSCNIAGSRNFNLKQCFFFLK